MRIRGEHKRALSSILGRYIGRHGVSTYEIAHLTGIKKRTVESHVKGHTGPDYDQLFEYERVLGPDFVNARLELLGLHAVVTETGEEDGCPYRMTAEVTRAAADLGEAMEDRFIDHRERPKIRERFQRLAVRAWAFVHQQGLKTQ